MSRNFTILGDVADLFDSVINQALAFRDRIVSVADQHTFGIASHIPIYAALLTMNTAGVRLSQSFVDTLRLGNSLVGDGSAGSYLHDGLRILNVVGGAGAIIGRVSNAFRVIQASGTNICTFESASQGLRMTGQRLFISLEELLQSAGVLFARGTANVRGAVAAAEPGFFAASGGSSLGMVRRMWDVVRRMGIAVQEITPPSTAIEQVQTIAQGYRGGVFQVGIRFVRNSATWGHHHLLAVFSRSRGLQFVDTTGRIHDGIAALRVAYPQVQLAGPMHWIPTARVAVALTQGAPVAAAFATSAVPAVSIVLPVVPIAQQEAPPDSRR
jgi:hypothetical protein